MRMRQRRMMMKMKKKNDSDRLVHSGATRKKIQRM